MPSEPARWAKAQKMPRGGLNVYIPKGELEKLPDSLDLEAEVYVRRNCVDDNGRAKALLTLRNDIP